jgi:hypothetical protein
MMSVVALQPRPIPPVAWGSLAHRLSRSMAKSFGEMTGLRLLSIGVGRLIDDCFVLPEPNFRCSGRLSAPLTMTLGGSEYETQTEVERPGRTLGNVTWFR